MNDLKKNSLVKFELSEAGVRAYVYGEIDHHSAKYIREAIDEKIFEFRPLTLFLNLGAVDFMDSSGLGLIMGRYKLVRTYGGTTVIESPSHRVLKIIELARLSRIIKIQDDASHSDEEEAYADKEN